MICNVYDLFEKAKKTQDINLMRTLYETTDDITIKFNYAKMLAKRKKYAEARKILLDLANNKDSFAILELGKLEKQIGNIELAKSYFQSLLGTRSDAYAKLELGKLAKESGNVELARTYFESLVITRNDIYARLELGKLEKECGNIELARNYFQRLLNTKGDSHARLELGKLEKESGNILLARTYFEWLINEKNDNYAKLELGKLEKEYGNIELARTLFEELITSKNDAYARLELGKLEKECGNIDLARTHFEKVLNTKSDAYARLELGKLEKESGNKELARTYFECLLRTKGDVYAKLELGRLEFEEGNIELAKTYFESLITEVNSWIEIVLLIIVYIKENNYFEAMKLVNIALKNNIELPKSIVLFLSKELNIYITDMTQYWYSYKHNQLLDYDEYMAIDYIIEHHQTHFSEDIDIYSLFNTIGRYLTPDNKINKFDVYDNYMVLCPNCGKEGNNYLKVVTLPNSKKIITMFPYNITSDIEESIDDIEPEKVKKYNK